MVEHLASLLEELEVSLPEQVVELVEQGPGMLQVLQGGPPAVQVGPDLLGQWELVEVVQDR